MTKSFLIGFSLLAFAGALHAQQQQSQRQQGQPQRQQQQMQQEQKQQRGELRVSNLKDMEAVDAQGQDIGDLGDVVIDLNSGRVHAVVLERGGVLGVGGDNFAFAPSAVKPGKQPDQVVIDIDKQKLESRQGFARNQWPGMQDEYWGRVGGASGGKQSQAAAGSEGPVGVPSSESSPPQPMSPKATAVTWRSRLDVMKATVGHARVPPWSRERAPGSRGL
jgi:sporulation protein YlmC with PRC-barrel domain